MHPSPPDPVSGRRIRVTNPFDLARFDLLLLAIALLGAVPRLLLGATQYIEYDGYWHVFIATQDNWQNFWWEYSSNFHPPLFYLLLKAALWFGRTVLVYRAISLLTGVAAIFVIGKIAEKITLSRRCAAVVALAYGLALPSIIISCEVRSYMLSIFFLLISFYYFLDLLGGSGGSPKSRILFAAGAILAGCSHYSAFFYVFACLVVTAVFRISFSRQNLLKVAASDLATYAPIAGALSYLYLTHAGAHAIPQGHLVTYYLQPGAESVVGFLLRNTRNLLNFFSPVAFGAKLFPLALACLLLGCAWTIHLIRPRKPENTRAAATVLISVVLLAMFMLGGVTGKYPFGGELRQQFLLFPFFVLCGGVLADRLSVKLRNRRLVSAAWIAGIAVIAGVAAVTFETYPKSGTDLYTPQMSRFRQMESVPPAVYLDQFNLIIFFTHYHDWKWKFIGRSSEIPNVDMYSISRGKDKTLVFRDKARWNLDFRSPQLYADFSRCLRAAPALAVFDMKQGDSTFTSPEESALAKRILEMAPTENLCVKKLAVEGLSVYGELRVGRCESELAYLTKCTRCDDTSWNIVYSGMWTRGAFNEAANGTLTYTDRAGAAAEFPFTGAAVRYVYTKAFNRGMAEVIIDGVSRAVLDLYSPRIEWQSSTTFGGLEPGRHTIRIRVLGRHNSGSDASFVDVDELLVP